ncbi:hypothetical protein EDC48_11484 [Gibbsiella quercinecans]|nr:hypothetical protein EDC48_11484 [Gibbsiella quercinecans]
MQPAVNIPHRLEITHKISRNGLRRRLNGGQKNRCQTIRANHHLIKNTYNTDGYATFHTACGRCSVVGWKPHKSPEKASRGRVVKVTIAKRKIVGLYRHRSSFLHAPSRTKKERVSHQNATCRVDLRVVRTDLIKACYAAMTVGAAHEARNTFLCSDSAPRISYYPTVNRKSQETQCQR